MTLTKDERLFIIDLIEKRRDTELAKLNDLGPLELTALTDFYIDLITKIKADISATELLAQHQAQKIKQKKDTAKIPIVMDDTLTRIIEAPTDADQHPAMRALNIHISGTRGKKTEIGNHLSKFLLGQLITTKYGMSVHQLTELVKRMKPFSEWTLSKTMQYIDNRLRIFMQWELIKRKTDEGKMWVYYVP